MHFFNSRVIEQTTNTDFTAELKLSICLSPSLNKTLSTSKIDPRSQHINAFGSYLAPGLIVVIVSKFLRRFCVNLSVNTVLVVFSEGRIIS